MTTYCLEMRSTANWQDVRYREYTSSAKKAELFKDVPRISFTDSGHGIVPHVREHRGHREPRNMLLSDHVQDYITAKGREVKSVAPKRREMTAADAPCHYGPQEADAWASGYNAALGPTSTLIRPASGDEAK